MNHSIKTNCGMHGETSSRGLAFILSSCEGLLLSLHQQSRDSSKSIFPTNPIPFQLERSMPGGELRRWYQPKVGASHDVPADSCDRKDGYRFRCPLGFQSYASKSLDMIKWSGGIVDGGGISVLWSLSRERC